LANASPKWTHRPIGAIAPKRLRSHQAIHEI
jgi:hypothetical protein